MNLVTETGFPHGLRCARCGRVIEEGEVYVGEPSDVTADGIPAVVLVCTDHPPITDPEGGDK